MRSPAIAIVPRTTPTIVRQEPIWVKMRIAAPMRQAMVDVSPIEPGIRPKKASSQGVLPTVALVKPSIPAGLVPAAAWAR